MPGPYNPLSDATIMVYRSATDHTNPMIGILRSESTGDKTIKGAACYLRHTHPTPTSIYLTMDESGNMTCYVNDKPTEHYTVKLKGRKQKRIWAMY